MKRHLQFCRTSCRWRAGQSMCSVNAAHHDMRAICNPFDNTLLAELPIASESEALSAIADGLSGAALSRELSRADRAAILTAAAALVGDQLEDFAEVIVSESGKTIRQARLEVSRCINTLTLSAEEAKRLAGEIIPFDACPGSENRLGFYRREPLGLICGNPRDESTDIGPMITATAAELALAGVRAAKDEGATILCGGKRDGAVLQPTVLENVAERSVIRCEEVFAPIVMIDRFDDYQAAIGAANSPQTMLHAGLFTESLETAFLAIDGIEAAGIMVNDSSDYRLDAMPFGGFKYGSMGREGVRFAMEEMTQTKVVCFNRYTQRHEGRVAKEARI